MTVDKEAGFARRKRAMYPSHPGCLQTCSFSSMKSWLVHTAFPGNNRTISLFSLVLKRFQSVTIKFQTSSIKSLPLSAKAGCQGVENGPWGLEDTANLSISLICSSAFHKQPARGTSWTCEIETESNSVPLLTCRNDLFLCLDESDSFSSLF